MVRMLADAIAIAMGTAHSQPAAHLPRHPPSPHPITHLVLDVVVGRKAMRIKRDTTRLVAQRRLDDEHGGLRVGQMTASKLPRRLGLGTAYALL